MQVVAEFDNIDSETRLRSFGFGFPSEPTVRGLESGGLVALVVCGLLHDPGLDSAKVLRLVRQLA